MVPSVTVQRKSMGRAPKAPIHTDWCIRCSTNTKCIQPRVLTTEEGRVTSRGCVGVASAAMIVMLWPCMCNGNCSHLWFFCLYQSAFQRFVIASAAGTRTRGGKHDNSKEIASCNCIFVCECMNSSSKHGVHGAGENQLLKSDWNIPRSTGRGVLDSQRLLCARDRWCWAALSTQNAHSLHKMIERVY